MFCKLLENCLVISNFHPYTRKAFPITLVPCNIGHQTQRSKSRASTSLAVFTCQQTTDQEEQKANQIHTSLPQIFLNTISVLRIMYKDQVFWDALNM